MLEAPFARPLLRFRLLGVPFHVEATFLIATYLLAGGERVSLASFAVWAGAVFVSVVLHELGHALVGRRFGLVPTIRLYGWGGLTSWTSGDAPDPWQRLAIAVAGPFVGIVTGAASLLALRHVPDDARLLRLALGDFVWVSLYWGAANLVPLLPLDGGNACQALLTRFAPANAVRGARAVSAVTGVLVGIALLRYGWMIGAAVAFWLGIDSGRQLFLAERQRADDALRARVAPGFEAAIEARDGETLVALAGEARTEARLDRTKAWVLEHLAIGHALRGSFGEAAAALREAPAATPAGVAIEGFVVQLAVRRRKRDLASAAGADPEAWENAGSPGDEDDPWRSACARLREGREAVVDALSFARVREAADVLGRDAEAASIGEGLLESAPDPDLAFAPSRAQWARAGEAARAGELAAKAVALGFRDWERAAGVEALAGKGGERVRGVMERVRRSDEAALVYLGHRRSLNGAPRAMIDHHTCALCPPWRRRPPRTATS